MREGKNSSPRANSKLHSSPRLFTCTLCSSPRLFKPIPPFSHPSLQQKSDFRYFNCTLVSIHALFKFTLVQVHGLFKSTLVQVYARFQFFPPLCRIHFKYYFAIEYLSQNQVLKVISGNVVIRKLQYQMSLGLESK